MAARRTVSVALEVKAAGARKEIRGAATDVEKLESAVVDTGRGLDKMSDKAAKAGRGAEKAAAGTKVAKAEAEAYKRELGSLDRQIDATILHLKVLGREFAGTGDKSTLARIKAERAMLSQLQMVRKSLQPDNPGTAGSGIMSGLPASPVLIGSLVAIAAAATPAIGAAIGGAVLGGIGTGGIIGGIAAAAKDDRVRSAGSKLGDTLASGFRDAGTPFIQPLVRSLGELEQTSASFTSGLQRDFARLAPVIGPLTKGVDGLMRGISNGLDKIFSGPAQQALRALANELPEIGSAIDDALSAISDGSDGATMGFIELLHVVEDFIRGTGELIGWLSRVFEWFVNVGYAVTKVELDLMHTFRWLERIPGIGKAFGLVRDGIQALNDEDASLLEGLQKSKDATGDWNRDLLDLRDTIKEQTAALRAYNDALEKQLGIVLGLPEAQIRFNQQWAETNEALKKGERTLNIATKAGQDHKLALIDLIRSADAVKEAEYAKTGSLDDATRAYDRQLTRIRDMAVKLGYNKRQVDALIESVKTGNLLGGLTVPVTMPGLATYTARLNYYISRLGIAKGLAAAEFATYREGERSLSRRWGGVTEHAATGTLRNAAVYSGGPTRYAFAEPSTGGEAFIPKNGPYGRAMAIMSQAAGWYGASVVPHRAAVGGMSTVVHRHVLVVEGTGVLSGLRREVELLGGNVQSALGSR